MHIHHIVPQSSGGPGTYNNGIPVCLDCHAEIESVSNMGRSFSAEELRQLRERWFAIVRKQPDVLIRARHAQSDVGPLQAMLGELEYNLVAVSGDPAAGFPPLATDQFRRAISANALAALPKTARITILHTYVIVNRVNYHFQELARMDRTGASFAATQSVRNDLRQTLHQTQIPEAIVALESCLG